MEDPNGATYKDGKPRMKKTSYVVRGVQISNGSFAQIYAVTDASSSQVLFLTVDQHQQGMHAVRIATKSDAASKSSHWLPRHARIRTALR